MARLPYLTPETARTPAVADALRELPPMNVFGLTAHAEGVFRPWVAFSGALLNETELAPILRELAILRVAALSPGADYEWEQHETLARALGASDAQIEGARSGDADAPDETLVLRFTEEVLRDCSPSDATFAAAQARFSTREIVELLLVIGQYMMVARVMATTRIDPDPPIGTALLDALAAAKPESSS